MNRWQRVVVGLVATVLVGVLAWQAIVVSDLRSELDDTRAELVSERRQREDDDRMVTDLVGDVIVKVNQIDAAVGGSSFDVGDLSSRLDDVEFDVSDLDTAVGRLERCTDSLDSVVRGFGSFTFC